MYKYLFLIQNILKNIIFITNVIKIELQKYNTKIQYKNTIQKYNINYKPNTIPI